jgi:transposase
MANMSGLLDNMTNKKTIALSYLQQGVSVNTLVNQFHVSPSTVYNSRHVTEEQKSKLMEPIQVKRPKLSSEQRARIEEFIKTECPVKSGTQYHYQYITSRQLYSDYCAFESGKNSKPVSLKTFRKIKKSLHIRKKRGYWGMFDCKTCAEEPRLNYQLNNQSLNPDQKSKLTAQLNRTKVHHQVRATQRKEYRRQQDDLKSNQALVVQDFTTFNPLVNVADNRKFNSFPVHVLCIESNSNSNSESNSSSNNNNKNNNSHDKKLNNNTRKFYDFVCSDNVETNKNDYY